MAKATQVQRRSSRLGTLLIGAAVGYMLADWMARNDVKWNDVGQRLMPATPSDGPTLTGRIAIAREAARRAMAERRGALEDEAGRALAGADDPRKTHHEQIGARGAEPAI